MKSVDYTKWEYPEPPFKPKRRYSGYVTDIDDCAIFCRVYDEYDLINSTKPPPEFNMEFVIDDIPKSEDDYVVDGAYFKFWIGYNDEFHVVFNRRTRSQEEVDTAIKEATELYEALNEKAS